jgi:two-component system, cell cycle sensor histidine kinase DivJ
LGLFAPIHHYIATLVHPTAQQDALSAARHRAFIAPRLLGSVIALACFPAYLLVRGAPSTIELVAFAWLIVPILIAYFLSRTGRYESAHILSSLALTGLVTAMAASTGGIVSFAAVWLVVVPLEAALSASRRVVALASIFALGSAGLLVGLSELHMLAPAHVSAAQATLGVVSAALFATGLALGAEAQARMNFWLLYAEEDRYRLLARNMTDVITRHGRDGAVLFASPAAESVFGIRGAQLHGHGLFERVHVADRPAYLTALGDAGALGAASSVEFRVRRDTADADGRPTAEFLWIEMRCRPFERTAAAATPVEGRDVVAVLRDVTERKRLQQAQLDAHAEAAHANDAKSRFLATMSHELRTPLNAVIGFSDMLMKEEELLLDGNRRNEYAGLINNSGKHLLAVVNGILDMSKIETGNFTITPEPFAPAHVVAVCCDLLALRANESGVRLERRTGADLPDVVADKRAVQQVLLNLVSNAIRFTDRGGTVTVAARAEAAGIVYVVEDDGVGISEADLARVGEPYFQAAASYERRHGGTGLGLSIVKGLVRLHGGDLSIESRVGHGTRVTVRLPLDCEQARPPQRPAVRHAAGVVSYLTSAASGDAPSNASGEAVVLPQHDDMRVRKSA